MESIIKWRDGNPQAGYSCIVTIKKYLKFVGILKAVKKLNFYNVLALVGQKIVYQMPIMQLEL